jgi:hypothetical protein
MSGDDIRIRFLPAETCPSALHQPAYVGLSLTEKIASSDSTPLDAF